MSLSWSRIIPTGAKGGAVSQEGVKFYRKVLQLLLDAGIVSHLGVRGLTVDSVRGG
jgi:beta-glucosidase/6-phospho-beta-glucosidase/beta-galactosidase